MMVHFVIVLTVLGLGGKPVKLVHDGTERFAMSKHLECGRVGQERLDRMVGYVHRLRGFKGQVVGKVTCENTDSLEV